MKKICDSLRYLPEGLVTDKEVQEWVLHYKSLSVLIKIELNV